MQEKNESFWKKFSASVVIIDQSIWHKYIILLTIIDFYDINIPLGKKKKMAEKSVFEQIKKQNGETFAKVIRAYDNGIFDVSGLAEIVKYAGREAEPIIPYLESLKRI